MTRTGYPSNASDEEWAFAAPYLTLMKEDAPQRSHDLREVFNGLRWLVRTGGQWRMLPNDFPPWPAVYQQAQRWVAAGVFESMAHDLRVLLRLAEGKEAQPSAVIVDGRTMQSIPESGGRAGRDGSKRKNGSKIHMAVDTLGLLLALHVTPADEQERDQIGKLAEEVQAVTKKSVKVCYADQGDTGDCPAQAAKDAGIELIVITLPEAKKGFALLPKRWGVERSFAWAARFRRLARDFERTSEILRGLHFVVFSILMLHHLVRKILESS